MFSNTVVSVEGLDDLLWPRHNAEYRYAGWCHKQMVVLMDFLVEKSKWGEEGGVVILFFLWELRRKGVFYLRQLGVEAREAALVRLSLAWSLFPTDRWAAMKAARKEEERTSISIGTFD